MPCPVVNNMKGVPQKMKKLILASNSPRRRELLQSAGFIFDIIPAKSDEEIPPNTPPEKAVTMLARQKAEEVRALHPDSVIIAADTVVAVDGDILGKPADASDAFAMLKRLSGRRHYVYTGVAIIYGTEKSEVYEFYEKTEVEFHSLTDSEITDYINTGEPFDKAGAYGIQEKGMLLVKSINGDFYNVMGLPISTVSRKLRELELTENSVKEEENYKIGDLLAIMARLRTDCPWDREQTHASIRANVIEEAYEVAEAIDNADPAALCEELGDLLLQAVFHAKMAEESGEFNFDDICDGICKKLIYRHPHVFGDVEVGSTSEVLKNWDSLKSAKKGEKTVSDRLESVPKTLPALMRAEKIAKRAEIFDCTDLQDALGKVREQLSALESLLNDDLGNIHKKSVEIEEIFGQILFACCNLGRFLKKDCEKALTFTLNKVIMRFGRFEDSVLKSDEN